MIARLIPIDGGSPVPLRRDVTVVGRDKETCDLFVNNRSVSKLHCILVKSDGLLFVRDLGSTNGTKVNGQKITRGALLPGDQLAFASAKFKVFLGPGEEEPESGLHTEELSEKDVSAVFGAIHQPVLDPTPPLDQVEESRSDVRMLTEDELREVEEEERLADESPPP